MDKILFLISIIPDIVMVASIICAITPTPKDDEVVGKLEKAWSKIYKIIDIMALNIFKAKDK